VTQASDRLHAAAALGLLAKNVRNLPLLKPEHRPTPEKEFEALTLSQDIAATARTARRSARGRWGRLDARLSLGSRGPKARRIITHADPDGDALASVWLVESYLLAGEGVRILFVPRERVLGCLRPGDCLVDVGNTHDAARFLYDHKPPALPCRHDSCAAQLVWQHLLGTGKPVQHLEEFIQAAFAGDSLKRPKEFAATATASKRSGFPTALDAVKKRA